MSSAQECELPPSRCERLSTQRTGIVRSLIPLSETATSVYVATPFVDEELQRFGEHLNQYIL
jgi:hypothetical protein